MTFVYKLSGDAEYLLICRVDWPTTRDQWAEAECDERTPPADTNLRLQLCTGIKESVGLETIWTLTR